MFFYLIFQPNTLIADPAVVSLGVKSKPEPYSGCVIH